MISFVRYEYEREFAQYTAAQHNQKQESISEKPKKLKQRAVEAFFFLVSTIFFDQTRYFKPVG